MSDLKDDSKRSPIKRAFGCLVRSPKSSTPHNGTACTQENLDGSDTRMENEYFSDSQSRENLSTNPGDAGKHLLERSECTRQNHVAEIERRVWGHSEMRDWGYTVDDPLHVRSYGHKALEK
ncbi:uncharacterized protein A1O9_06187 [Exophiala aquamarina CBS 119918]|uniref:Uncharacterized protein n=1 Tax=Exophiala aquamarina CBS 119918 TaxID=1182545 RepID=A0A072PEL4_9EURO|nr:uncharacterized protein A1O9_06187 [Exophiala aquamarina CBS 119918]KEF58261.1 hypothetical protein A1O9_06187 [Exophiala aquamarina CBS 119918]